MHNQLVHKDRHCEQIVNIKKYEKINGEMSSPHEGSVSLEMRLCNLRRVTARNGRNLSCFAVFPLSKISGRPTAPTSPLHSLPRSVLQSSSTNFGIKRTQHLRIQGVLMESSRVEMDFLLPRGMNFKRLIVIHHK